MELPCEGLAQNGPFHDAIAINTGIGISQGAKNMLLTNQTPPEIDAPPLQPLQLHPISIINFAVGGTTPLNANNSPLTAPSMTIGTRGSDAMETTDAGESSEETAAWQLVSIQNTAYECNETGVALSVPQTTAQLQFNARDTYHDGYYSDGELGPFFDAVMVEPSESEDEEELPTIGAPSLILLPICFSSFRCAYCISSRWQHFYHWTAADE
jgi:hypothetical protein